MQDLARLHDIAAVLIRHGLGDVVRRLGLAHTLARAGQALHLPQADALARLEPPEQLRRALEELGPTFVKLGQILAGRADLLGPEWTAELSKLHSRVPAVPLEALREQLVADLGGQPETVFAEFDPQPLAAGSIAQVHRARLPDGRAVVVKIRRPGIQAVVEADLRLLARVAASAEADWPALQPYRPVQLVREFARSLRRELDLANECRQAERIAHNLAALPEVQVPAVHWAYTHERVNVQDLIEGVPGEDLACLATAGLNRRTLAQTGARVLLKMIVEDGLFHADPHPGNVFYLPGNRIALIDFGMVGRLSMKRREQLLQLLLGLVERRPPDVAEVLLEWAADHRAGLNLEQLEDEIEAFVDQYHGVPLAQLHLGQMLAEVTHVLREHHLTLPPDLALLIKAFVTLEGMGRALDPEFHMTAEALPLLRRVMAQRYQPRVLLAHGWAQFTRGLRLAQGLPDDLARLVRRARHGQLRVGVEIGHIRRVGDQLERASSRLSLALVIAALIIGSSIVMTVGGGPSLFGLPALGLLGFVAAVVGGLALLRSIWRGFRARQWDDS